MGSPRFGSVIGEKKRSCYGFPGFGGDANADFEMYITDQDKDFGNFSDKINALHSTIRSRHAMSGHGPFSIPSTKLPEWGFGQHEVTRAGQGAEQYLDRYIEEITPNFCPSLGPTKPATLDCHSYDD